MLHSAFAARGGDRDRIFGVLYEELRRVAAGSLGRQLENGVGGLTSIVHEAYLRMAASSRPRWSDREHFVAWVAVVLRSVRVDRARAARAGKRGGDVRTVPIDERITCDNGPSVDVLDLDEALNELAQVDPKGAQVVEMRYFCGLSREEIADVLHVHESTVRRRWRMARGWLSLRLQPEGDVG